MPKCTFCGDNIEKGTGKMFVYSSGKVANFCSNKCEKNLLKLKRKPLNVKWTAEYRKEHKKGQSPLNFPTESKKDLKESPKVEKKQEAVKEEAPKVEDKQEAPVEEKKAPAPEAEAAPKSEDKKESPVEEAPVEEKPTEEAKSTEETQSSEAASAEPEAPEKEEGEKQ